MPQGRLVAIDQDGREYRVIPGEGIEIRDPRRHRLDRLRVRESDAFGDPATRPHAPVADEADLDRFARQLALRRHEAEALALLTDFDEREDTLCAIGLETDDRRTLFTWARIAEALARRGFAIDTDSGVLGWPAGVARPESTGRRRGFQPPLPDPLGEIVKAFPDARFFAPNMFPAGVRERLRPMAETLAMIDGNAFFGILPEGEPDFWEYYVPLAHSIFQANGGLEGWAGEASFASGAAL